MALSRFASAFSIACWHFARSSACPRGVATKNKSAIATAPAVVDLKKNRFNGVLLSILFQALRENLCQIPGDPRVTVTIRPNRHRFNRPPLAPGRSGCGAKVPGTQKEWPKRCETSFVSSRGWSGVFGAGLLRVDFASVGVSPHDRRWSSAT